MAPTESNEPGITSGLAAIHRVVEMVAGKGIPRSRIILLGFSQGACLASTYAARNAERFGGVVVYSGGLIGPPGTIWDFEGNFAGTPVFLGCSDVDAHVPAGASAGECRGIPADGRRGDRAHLPRHGAPGEPRTSSTSRGC
jgi:predicted esterase